MRTINHFPRLSYAGGMGGGSPPERSSFFGIRSGIRCKRRTKNDLLAGWFDEQNIIRDISMADRELNQTRLFSHPVGFISSRAMQENRIQTDNTILKKD
jgi:hypothetical protein